MSGHFSKMIDLALTPADVKKDIDGLMGSRLDMDAAMERPKYSYGLCICLTKHEIEKMGLDIDGVEKGDMLHFCGMARVIDADDGQRETVGGASDSNPRIEMQITHMGIEDEDEENDEMRERGLRRYEEPEEEGMEEPGDEDHTAGEMHVEIKNGPKDGKESSKPVTRNGEAHLDKKNYKAA